MEAESKEKYFMETVNEVLSQIRRDIIYNLDGRWVELGYMCSVISCYELNGWISEDLEEKSVEYIRQNKPNDTWVNCSAWYPAREKDKRLNWLNQQLDKR